MSRVIDWFRSSDSVVDFGLVHVESWLREDKENIRRTCPTTIAFEYSSFVSFEASSRVPLLRMYLRSSHSNPSLSVGVSSKLVRLIENLPRYLSRKV